MVGRGALVSRSERGGANVSDGVKIAIGVGILVLAGVLYYVRSGSENALTSRDDYDTMMQCRACGHAFEANLKVEQLPPIACPKCGKMDAWRLYHCNQCDKTFVPQPVGTPPRAPMMPKCPHCGSQSTGAADLPKK